MIPLPEEVLLLAIGYASFTGLLNFWLAVLVSLVCVIIIDIFHFSISTHGHTLLKRFIGGRIMRRVRKAVEDHGPWTVFVARFIPGVRILTPFVAGSSGMKFRKFAIANILGAVIQTPLIVWIGYALGTKIEPAIRFVERLESVIPFVMFTLAGVILIAFIFYRIHARHAVPVKKRAYGRA